MLWPRRRGRKHITRKEARTPNHLGLQGVWGREEEGRGVKETHSGAWTPAGLHLFISQGVTVVCPAAEESVHV